jgi:tetratricopeptide (TPR) repeat protein
MELRGRIIALYGRFSPGQRDDLANVIADRGGRVIRDLTQRGDILVVGSLADSLIASGALPARLEIARRKGKAIYSEDGFRAVLADANAGETLTLPLATALTQSGASPEDAALLAAFGLITIRGDKSRFGDVAVLKTAAALREAACTQTEMVRILVEAKRSAPIGRHKVIISADGAPALQWEDGLTTLGGQGYLPLDLSGNDEDDLFEAAVVAEAGEQFSEALQLYDMCVRIDREDAIALYNIGNIHMRLQDMDAAALAYRRALARDEEFVEARYNLALVLEEVGRADEAERELGAILALYPDHADAVFNLAQVTLDAGRPKDARALFERYLTLSPPSDWAAKARKAILYCSTAS